MHIFVDESGPFELGAPTAKFSCVGALVIPDAQLDAVFAMASAFKARHGITGELKGSKLSDEQAAELVVRLAAFPVMFEVAVFCSESHDAEALAAFQRASAEGCTKHLTREYRAEMVAELVALEKAIAGLSPKLFAQSVVTVEVLASVVARAPLYYVQRSPAELGRFVWEFDPKDDAPTRKPYGGYDRVLEVIIGPWIQSRSGREPGVMLEGADYSHFAPFRERLPETPGYLVPLFGMKRPFEFTSITKILKSRTFPRSEDSLGLQLADALTNLTKRSLNGNLGDIASSKIGVLMVGTKRGSHVVRLIALGDGKDLVLTDRQAKRFVLHCDRIAKPMLYASRITKSRTISGKGRP